MKTREKKRTKKWWVGEGKKRNEKGVEIGVEIWKFR